MKTTLTKILAGTAIIAGLALTNSAQANLILNESFEQPQIANHSWQVFNSIVGWTTSFGAGIEIQNNMTGSAYDGNQFVELDSHYNSAMYQQVNTQAGLKYTLSYAYSPRPGQPVTTTPINLLINGSTVQTEASSGIGNNNTVWTIYKYTFIGSGSDRIEFSADGTSDSLGGYIDLVQMTAVPEPSTIIAGALLLLPFGAGAVRSIRKNRS